MRLLLSLLLILVGFPDTALATRRVENSTKVRRVTNGGNVRAKPFSQHRRSPPPVPRQQTPVRVTKPAPVRRKAVRRPAPQRRVKQPYRPQRPRKNFTAKVRPPSQRRSKPVIRRPVSRKAWSSPPSPKRRYQSPSRSVPKRTALPTSQRSNVPTFPPPPPSRPAEQYAHWPFLRKFRISSNFGLRRHPITQVNRLHAGTDIAAPLGTWVLSTYSGRVLKTGPNGGYGLEVVVSHNNDQFRTRYAHLQKILVHPNREIVQGTVLGEVGRTGRTTGPHLHIERLVRQPDNSFKPVDFGPDLKVGLVRLVQRAHLLKQRG